MFAQAKRHVYSLKEALRYTTVAAVSVRSFEHNVHAAYFNRPQCCVTFNCTGNFCIWSRPQFNADSSAEVSSAAVPLQDADSKKTLKTHSQIFFHKTLQSKPYCTFYS